MLFPLGREKLFGCRGAELSSYLLLDGQTDGPSCLHVVPCPHPALGVPQVGTSPCAGYSPGRGAAPAAEGLSHPAGVLDGHGPYVTRSVSPTTSRATPRRVTSPAGAPLPTHVQTSRPIPAPGGSPSGWSQPPHVTRRGPCPGGHAGPPTHPSPCAAGSAARAGSVQGRVTQVGTRV